MDCEHCHNDLSDRATRCPKCGEPTARATQTPIRSIVRVIATVFWIICGLCIPMALAAGRPMQAGSFALGFLFWLVIIWATLKT
jgi:hypothetical protein